MQVYRVLRWAKVTLDLGITGLQAFLEACGAQRTGWHHAAIVRPYGSGGHTPVLVQKSTHC